MSYTVEQGRKGPMVAYTCPRCRDQLKSPLTDAGNKDTCPTCGSALVVPGEKELITYAAEQVAAEAERKKRLAQLDYEAKQEQQRREEWDRSAAMREDQRRNAEAETIAISGSLAAAEELASLSALLIACAVIYFLCTIVAAVFIGSSSTAGALAAIASGLTVAVFCLVGAVLVRAMRCAVLSIRMVARNTDPSTVATAVARTASADSVES